MELSVICFKQICIMFLLAGVGFLCGKINIISKEMGRGLSKFVLEVVNPVLIFTSYQKEFDRELLTGLCTAFLLGFASYGLIIALTALLYKKRGDDEAIAEQFAAVYSNCGFMGIPLINGLFGSEGVFYLTGYVTVFNIMVWTHGVILFEGKGTGTRKTSLKKVISSPAVIAVIIGLCSFLTRPVLSGAVLPGAVTSAAGVFMSAAEHIAAMNTPLAMICAGVTIGGTSLGDNLRSPGIYRAAALRLIVCPLLFMLVFGWFGLPRVVFMTILAAAGCPAAATGTMFALRYKKCPEFSAVIFAVTTVLSAVTLPVWIMAANAFRG